MEDNERSNEVSCTMKICYSSSSYSPHKRSPESYIKLTYKLHSYNHSIDQVIHYHIYWVDNIMGITKVVVVLVMLLLMEGVPMSNSRISPEVAAGQNRESSTQQIT